MTNDQEDLLIFTVVMMILIASICGGVAMIRELKENNQCAIACQTLGYYTGDNAKGVCLCYEETILENAEDIRERDEHE